MQNLNEFVRLLQQRGLLAHVYCEVDADQEIPEIHRRVIAANGPALFFHKVKGSSFPVVSNLFGSAERIDLAFGQEPIRFLEEALHLVQQLFPLDAKKISGLMSMAPRLLCTGIKRDPLFSFRRPHVRGGVISPVDLEGLPLTKSWPEDGGGFLTLPLVYTEDPAGKGHNLGIYRMQRFDQKRMGMHWQIGKGGGFHYATAEEKNQPLPVNVHLGGPPALILAAVAPLPENVGELLLASFLLKRKLRLTSSGNHQLPVIADAEFAFLGHVPPKERHPEGPFGDHYGYYSLKHDYPVFHCEQIWHARGAIFPITVVGKPRQEDYYIGDYLQRLLKPLFPLAMPGVVDLWSYGETGFHALAAAVVKERYVREAMATAFRILGEGQLSLTKFLLVTNEAVELQRFSKILPHILERANFAKDLYVFNHLSMDTLDYTGPEVNKGSKAVLLGIGDPIRRLPHAFSASLPSGISAAKPFCPGCLVVNGPEFKKDPLFARMVAEKSEFANWPLIILVDDVNKTLRSEASFLWTTFTRFEPAADIYAAKQEMKAHHVSYQEPLVIDARMKPSYPRELFCAPRIKENVTRRWREYFPDDMEQGSSDDGHL